MRRITGSTPGPRYTTILFQKVWNVEEANKVASCYMDRDGVLIRKWWSPLCQSNDQEAIVHQILVPREMRPHVLELAHDNSMAGHLSVRKTKARIFEHFWWPKCCQGLRIVLSYVSNMRTRLREAVSIAHETL